MSNNMKWIISILLAIVIWPIVFIFVVISFELLLTIGLIAIAAIYFKQILDKNSQ
jgi:hypothetical protein